MENLEKSWSWNLKNVFPGLEKSWKTRKMPKVMENENGVSQLDANPYDLTVRLTENRPNLRPYGQLLFLLRFFCTIKYFLFLRVKLPSAVF